ncbi:hypothetical protein K431DRAFT_107910 [Polychaeton citri CBS 116435]|uniref:Zn(2)-C6 fungal-type domain-containing protein n=1 Tax=Polychaeton citri CBS 116435 TaxID=1314669 RepID=A0A9P4Q7Z9_9PEZI|nr:hypothetical protein K431DRAFT_107910 [Polychaeton citri CBS 116435]
MSRISCWTCRVRRKKCEPQDGRCGTCFRLGFSCDGYGPRPVWMDGGAREKLRREKLKTFIKLDNRKAWSQGSLAAHDYPQTGNLGSNATSHGCGWSGVAPMTVDPCEFLLPSPASASSTMAWPYIESQFLYDETGQTMLSQQTFQSKVADGDLDLEIEDDDEDSQRMESSKQNSNDGSEDGDRSRSNTSASCDPNLAASDRRPGIGTTPDDRLSRHDLIMHYLDSVFELQFPFHRYLPRSLNRGWLLKLIESSPCLEILYWPSGLKVLLQTGVVGWLPNQVGWNSISLDSVA